MEKRKLIHLNENSDETFSVYNTNEVTQPIISYDPRKMSIMVKVNKRRGGGFEISSPGSPQQKKKNKKLMVMVLVLRMHHSIIILVVV